MKFPCQYQKNRHHYVSYAILLFLYNAIKVSCCCETQRFCDKNLSIETKKRGGGNKKRSCRIKTAPFYVGRRSFIVRHTGLKYRPITRNDELRTKNFYV